MKAVILAGGLGTRLSEETSMRPKPLVEIGGMPILWHIMKIYSSHGINEFIICCGYKGYMVKEFFQNYYLHMSDVTFDLSDNSVRLHNNLSEGWKVTLVNTGELTMTGGRIKKIYEYVKNDDFCLTYGDGVSNVDITKLIKFHRAHKKLVTVTAVKPPGRFGALSLDIDKVKMFSEKIDVSGNDYINGGFFVVSPGAMEYISDENQAWEGDPLNSICKVGELMAYTHNGFWQPMDTLREKKLLDELWASGDAPWKSW
ncbi:MAG: hypothetical protein RLZZ196_3262 [Bacteroidota bacterium]